MAVKECGCERLLAVEVAASLIQETLIFIMGVDIRRAGLLCDVQDHMVVPVGGPAASRPGSGIGWRRG